MFIGIDIPGPAWRGLIRGDLDRKGPRYHARNLALHREDVGHLAVDAVRPEAVAGLSIGQLGGNPEYVSGQADRTAKQESDSKLLRDGLGIALPLARHFRRGGSKGTQRIAPDE